MLRHIYATLLVKGGLFYTGQQNVLKCSICSYTMNNWYHGRCPSRLHKLKCRYCPFVFSFPGTRPTLNLILKPKAKPMPIHYYQAVYRLQHYLIYPTNSITTESIDNESSYRWHCIVGNSIQREFKQTRMTRIQDKPQQLN